MSFFHNVPDKSMPDTGVELTACLLARIFSRDIKTWDHPDIMAINSKLIVPAGEPILVYHRVLGSSTTGGITTYLNAACPAVWGITQVGSVISWPADTFPAQGSSKMSASISANPWSIGYIDSGHGHNDGLKEVELANKAGIFRSSKEASMPAVDGIRNAASAGLAQGVLPADPSADFSAVSLHNMDGPDVWPIVAVSYAYVRADQTKSGTKACLLKAFLQFILSKEGQSMLPRYNFVGIPPAVQAVAQKAVDSIKMPTGPDACVEWTFEGDKTLPATGMQDFVMSAKRRDFGEYDRSDLRADMMGLISELHLKIDANHDVEVMEAADFASTRDTEQHADDEVMESSVKTNMAIAVAGLVIALLAFVFSVLAYFKVTLLSLPSSSLLSPSILPSQQSPPSPSSSPP
jgi:ABC-type phosphate transport system substrate-binding protein